MRVARRIGLALLGLVLAFAAITWLALERDGVALIETHAPDGSLRETHIWSVELDGSTWLEAGSPRNAWFADLGRDPRLRLTLDGATREAVARIAPEASPRIRAALRAKYGWRDAWIQILVNANQATAVRLVDAPSAPPS